MPEGLVTMSGKEIDRLSIVSRVLERRLSQKRAWGARKRERKSRADDEG